MCVDKNISHVSSVPCVTSMHKHVQFVVLCVFPLPPSPSGGFWDGVIGYFHMLRVFAAFIYSAIKRAVNQTSIHYAVSFVMKEIQYGLIKGTDYIPWAVLIIFILSAKVIL